MASDSTPKVALVTGSGKRRVGNVIARALADRGFAVAVHYNTSQSEAVETVGELKARGVDAFAIAADLTCDSDVQRLIDEVVERHGRIDVLVNSAAVWIPKSLEETSAADVRRQFDVNTLGTFLCAQRTGLRMIDQVDGGAIINIGDWAIDRPYLNYAAYFVSKGSIPTITRCLAVELGCRNPRVRVNCILPGPVMLPASMPQAERDAIAQATLVKREGQPDHVVQAVLFLIDNDFVTGTCLRVDGGRSIYAAEE